MVFSAAITRKDIFTEVLSKVNERSFGKISTTSASLQSALSANLRQLFTRSDILLILIVFIIYIAWCCTSKRREHNLQNQFVGHLQNITPFAISIGFTGALPLAWYVIFQQHSIIHYWMTYRNLLPTLLSIFTLIWIAGQILILRRAQLSTRK
jgi:hypothetical protein